jgi:capsular exopolysaccharide synthesis family protein
MERIKQAIEKVKQQQISTGALPPQAAPVPDAARGGSRQVNGLEALTYTQTRVFELNPLHLEKHRIVTFNKNDPMSIGFDMLRTQVLLKMEEKGWRTLAITSPMPESGKTVVSINLAISIAHQPQKSAVLVDFDLRKPRVAAYLGMNGGTSLNEVLRDEAGLSEALVNPGLPRLVVLPAMKPLANSAEMLSSRKVGNLIKELRARYDSRIVLFDLPPLLYTDDAITLINQVDCVLMVVGNGMSTQSEIEQSLHHLRSANLLGVVLNMAEIPQRNYYY